MNNKSILFFLFILGIIYINCAEKIITEVELDPELFPKESTSKFNDIQQKIFTPSCAISGCHTGSSPVLNLDLSEGQAYSNLVNINSTQEPTLKLVAPNNSLDSYLLRKLTATNTSVMPPAGQLNKSLIDSVGAWIDSGAPNN